MNVSRSPRFGIVLSGLLLSAWGCGGSGDGPATFTVSGSVDFAGAPLRNGEIRFVSTDGARIDGGQITDGKYSLRTTPGAKRVEIYATRQDDKNMVESAIEPGKLEPATEMYIPAKYNSASELKADVTAEGDNNFSFPLDA